MPEWLIERGIGETRTVRVAGDEIVEARILLDGIVRAGSRIAARLTQSRPRTIAVADGQEYWLPKGAPDIAEGGAIVIEITRESIPGLEPWKRPLAQLSDLDPASAPPLSAEELPFPTPADRLGGLGWDELLEQARSGIVRFTGGELRISPTPAMTLIDVDGFLPPRDLALAGAEAAARAILRLDIGGSIGIDLPSISGKADRQAAGDAIDRILPRPFERTAINGFGFIQIVRRRSRASLIELAQDRAAFEARALLRRSAFEPPGAKCLVGNPAVVAMLKSRPDWLDRLARQVGGAVGLRADPNLPMSCAYAEPA